MTIPDLTKDKRIITNINLRCYYLLTLSGKSVKATVLKEQTSSTITSAEKTHGFQHDLCAPGGLAWCKGIFSMCLKLILCRNESCGSRNSQMMGQ